jgi:two-component system sensor histidine kinase RegB
MASPEDDEPLILSRWLQRLRWAVLGVLALTLPLGERFFELRVRYAIAIPILVFAAVKDRWLVRIAPPRRIAVGVALDQLAIAGVLAASGGPANPFSALLFVHVALAASLLPRRTTFLLAGLGAVSFAALFALPASCCASQPTEHGAFSAHLTGMWMAYVMAAAIVAFFLTHVRDALEQRAQEITLLRRRAEEGARFTALGTLAAGTAHELATPLGTIAVLAGEIADAPPGDRREEAVAIQAQVARCRDVITKMQGAARASEARGHTALVAAVEQAIATWAAAHPSAAVELRAHAAASARVRLSASELEVALCALLDNALHAVTTAGNLAPIAVEVATELGAARIDVTDRGAGIPAELVGRLGEPFLTTKEPGEGMGLGLYLVRRLLAEAGGRLAIRSAKDGTRVTVHLEASEC